MTPLRTTCVTELACLRCGRLVPDGNVQTCPSCGPEGILDVRYDYDRVGATLGKASLEGRSPDHWRYAELLPVPAEAPRPPLRVGWTPVYEVPRLASAIGAGRLFLKDDGRNPTASFKDRASSVGVMKAIEFGLPTIACASTGNAASSLAGLAAAVGLRSVIFIPERAPAPKVAQLLVFGAVVLRVSGSYEEAFDLCARACAKFGWYNRNSGTNPFLVEGKKTAGLEIAEQCGEAIPDWVVVAVGDGCTIGGIGKGLAEMHRLGFIPRIPRLLGVQAECAAPVVRAFMSGQPLVPVRAETLADSIAVGTPRNWRRAVSAVSASGGSMIAVSDGEILEAVKSTARLGGVFGEPAGVAGIAGLRKAIARGAIGRRESALAVITGNGLKDIGSAMKAGGEPLDVAPDIASLERALAERGVIPG
ncbi:MAG TPA: threonine synthase [Bacteroidota bacterium]|nr:threonine synthase [Bacteroidota bacterium]